MRKALPDPLPPGEAPEWELVGRAAVDAMANSFDLMRGRDDDIKTLSFSRFPWVIAEWDIQLTAEGVEHRFLVTRTNRKQEIVRKRIVVTEQDPEKAKAIRDRLTELLGP